jgi:hypothetical protein
MSGGMLCIPFSSFSQSSSQEKVTRFLNEVYLNCPEYVDSIHISRSIEFLERVKLHTVKQGEYPECLLLSNVALKNKCNASLTNDVTQFNWDDFNPFKYLFSFYSTQTAFFRVDGTDYIIEISPVK